MNTFPFATHRSISARPLSLGATLMVILTSACSDHPHATSGASVTYAGTGSVPAAPATPPTRKGTNAADAIPDAGPSPSGPNFTDVDAGAFLCNPAARWSAGKGVTGLPAGAHAVAFSVTPDELCAAWVDDAGDLHVADRATRGDTFGQDKILAWPPHASPPAFSLSDDGLRLAFVKPDAKGFSEITRTSRQADFDDGADAAFALVNQWVVSLGATVSDPAFGADGDTFFYSQFGGQVTVSESRRARAGADVAWPAGSPRGGPPVSPVQMDATTFYRHPVSSSADGLTLFICDDYPTAPTARAVYRTSLGGELRLSVELGSWSSVHPNAACTRLYYVEGGRLTFSDRI